jgi:hypothetical protein
MYLFVSEQLSARQNFFVEAMGAVPIGRALKDLQIRESMRMIGFNSRYKIKCGVF